MLQRGVSIGGGGGCVFFCFFSAGAAAGRLNAACSSLFAQEPSQRASEETWYCAGVTEQLCAEQRPIALSLSVSQQKCTWTRLKVELTVFPKSQSLKILFLSVSSTCSLNITTFILEQSITSHSRMQPCTLMEWLVHYIPFSHLLDNSCLSYVLLLFSLIYKTRQLQNSKRKKKRIETNNGHDLVEASPRRPGLAVKHSLLCCNWLTELCQSPS